MCHVEKRDEPNWNCSLSISRIEAGATRWREISCRQATPLSKFGNTMEPYLRQSGIGLIFMITSVTTPSVPANSQYTTGAVAAGRCSVQKGKGKRGFV